VDARDAPGSVPRSAPARTSVLYHLPYPDGVGADRWIAEAWRSGFETLGHAFHLLRAGESLDERAHATGAGLFFSAVNLLSLEAPGVRDSLRAIRVRGTKVFLWVHWPLGPTMGPRRAAALAREDVADVYFGERERMDTFEQETGKPYHVIPNAADPRAHFPVAPVRKYAYDVVYLGANLRKKRWFAEAVLRPLQRRYRVGLFGPGWTVADTMLRAASKACKTVGAFRWAKAVDARRISVPPDEERQLYSSARIALNFHEREDDGSQPHYIVNQRAFKIPACGGFQLCDDVPALRQYFARDEIVLAGLDAEDWLGKVAYFLAHDDQRRAIQARGTERALRDHLSTNRVRQVLTLAYGPSPADAR